MPHWVDRFVLASLKNCGTGSGGFEAGNNCASGGGALTETKDIGTRETTDAEAAGRGEAIAQHLGGLSGAEFTKETARILTASGMSKEEAKVFAKSLDRSMNHAIKTLTPLAGWDSPSAALEAVRGAACGYVAGIALYKELTGNGLDETSITAGSLTIGSSLNDINRTLEEPIGIYPEAKKADYMGYFGLMVKEGKTVDSRPRIAINVLMAAAEENRRTKLLAMNLSPSVRSLARVGLGEGNFTIGEAIVEMGTAPSDNANINGIAFSGDRESFRRMATSGFGRTALKAMHTVAHELGHWQHYKVIEQTTRAANPDLTGVERWRATTKAWRARTNTDAQGGWKSAAEGVSRYARSSSNEFVAEVYSGLAMGFRFNEDVLREYAALGGPARKRKAS
jgi:hypothetical protein